MNMKAIASISQSLLEDEKEAKEAEAVADEAKTEAKSEEKKADDKNSTGPQADKIAANASKDKAKKLELFANTKVMELIAKALELDLHVKDQLTLLEDILMKITIDANFDPESQEDLDWVEGEMVKILEEVPEIKILEDKLNLSKNITSPLDAVIAHLENATSIVGMAKKKQEEKANKTSNATKDDKNGTKGGGKKKTDNATVTKKDDGKKADAAPAKDDKKKDEAPKAALVSKASAIIEASPTNTVVISKGEALGQQSPG